VTAPIALELTEHQRAIRAGTLPDALDLTASRWPDELALIEIEGEGRSLTWAQFRDDVDRVRSGLEAAGVTRQFLAVLPREVVNS